MLQLQLAHKHHTSLNLLLSYLQFRLHFLKPLSCNIIKKLTIFVKFYPNVIPLDFKNLLNAKNELL